MFCTHLHADHVGWNTRLESGRWTPTFPNARYLVGETELAFWQEAATESVGINHGSFQDSVLPVLEAGLVTSRLELSSDGKALNYFEVTDFVFHLTPAAVADAAKTLTAKSET